VAKADAVEQADEQSASDDDKPLSEIGDEEAAQAHELALAEEQLEPEPALRSEPARLAVHPPDSFRTKRVSAFGRSLLLALQSENGPCPLLAIANALVLRGRLELPDAPRVAVSTLLDLVAEQLLQSGDGVDENRVLTVAEALEVLPRLATGLDVNVRFTQGVGGFEFTRETSIFDLLNLPLVHGWLADKADAATCVALGSQSYNELVAGLVSDGTPMPQRAAVEEWLAASGSQLTAAGVEALHALPNSTLCILFRGNHFATAFKHPASLMLLVTDEGYADDAAVVWEPLSQDGSTPFLTGDFRRYEPPQPPDAAAAEAELRRREEADLAEAQRLSQEEPGPGEPGGLSRPLFASAEAGDVHGALVALSAGCDINARDVVGRTPLHWAVAEGHAEMATLLLTSGAKVNAQDDGGLTPLHCAAATNAFDLVRLLLEHRANAALQDARGQVAFQLATAPEVRKSLHAQAALHAAERIPQRPPQQRPAAQQPRRQQQQSSDTGCVCM